MIGYRGWKQTDPLIILVGELISGASVCTCAMASQLLTPVPSPGTADSHEKEKVMKKLYVIALMGFALGLSQGAFAEVVNMTNSADGADRGSGISAVKEKLNAACKERGGTPDPESFEVVFEKTSPNPDVPKPYYVDAKMKCDLP